MSNEFICHEYIFTESSDPHIKQNKLAKAGSIRQGIFHLEPMQICDLQRSEGIC